MRGGPPEDPHTCAHLLTLAGHLSANHYTLRELIPSVTRRSPWIRELQSFIRHCSPALQAAAGPTSTHNYRETDQPAAAPFRHHLPAEAGDGPEKTRVEAPLLARILGLHPSIANRWSELAGRTYGGYAGRAAQRGRTLR